MKFGKLTQICPVQGHIVKISNFLKTKSSHFEKITKIAISQHRIGRSLRNLARLCKMGPLTIQTVEKFEFPKSKMADGRHFENR